MSKLVINVLGVIFLDNLYLSTGLWLVFLTSLIARKFFNFDYPYLIAISSWLFLVFFAAIVAVIFTIEFFSHEKGMDRLALVPYILGGTPLFVCAIVALFIFPKK
jgi:hypothetical protein